MANPFFPNWVTADIVLDILVDTYFAPKVNLSGSDIVVRFIPDHVQEAVPEEDRETFVRIYNDFAHSVCNQINLHGIVAPYLYQMVTPLMELRLLGEITTALDQLDAVCTTSLKDSLKGNLGLMLYRKGVNFKVTLDQREFKEED